MRIPTWAFAFLRIGIIALIYLRFGPRYDLLYGQPLLYYGLPFFMLLATLGIHRYWMFALGTLLLCTSLADLAPDFFFMNRFQFFMLGVVTFFLGFAPCDRDYSVRAWWSAEQPGFLEFKAWPELTWNIYRLMVCFLFLRFVLLKSTPLYMSGSTIAAGITSHFWGADFLYQPWFGAFCAGLAIFLYLLNLILTVAVWFPRSYPVFVPLAAGFCAVHLGLTQNNQMIQLLLLLLLIPFAAVQRLDKPLTIHQGIPVSF